MRIAALCMAFFAGMAGVTAGAQAPSRGIDAFDETFGAWMKENGVGKGVLAVGHEGRLVFERGYGGQDPGERVLLASLSKAITGRCIAGLIAARKLGFDSRVADVLAPFFGKSGAPADPRLGGATVAQLLVHRAGFPPAPRDLMTPAAMELLQKTRSPATATPAELLAATLTAPLASAPGEAFRYSNTGYLVLGVMVETLTGESYEQFCGRTVLEPAGIKAPALDSNWRAFSAFGGWKLSGREYVRALDRKLEAARREGVNPRPWLPVNSWSRSPLDKWTSNDERGIGARYYALGQFAQGRHDPGADRFFVAPGFLRTWHAGTWGVPPDTVGMLAMQHESGASWFAWYTPRPGKDATDALTDRLAALPPSIGAWPARDLYSSAP